MALIKCTECGKEYSNHALACPNCSCPNLHYEKIKKNASKTSIIKPLIIIAIILILGFGMIVLFFGTNAIFHPEKSDFDMYPTNNNLQITTTPTSEKEPVIQDTPEKEDIWKVKYYVDEFNQPTDYSYIIANIDGTFSNGAANNSYLLVKFLFDSSNISFELYEYGKYKVSNYSDEKYEIYDIKVKGDSDITYNYKGSTKPGSNRITISPFDICSFFNILKEKEELHIHISSKNDKTTTYLFTLTKDNLIELYDEQFNIKDNSDKNLNEVEKTLIGAHSLVKVSIIGKPSKDTYRKSEATLTLNEDKTFILSLDNINLFSDENDAFSFMGNQFLEGSWSAEYDDMFEKTFIDIETIPKTSIYGLLEDDSISIDVKYANDTYEFKFTK